MHSLFTLFFDGSFWVGIYEVQHEDGTVQAARQVFGAQPSDAQLWDWTLREGGALIQKAHDAPRITPTADNRIRHSRNPKRVARLAAKEAAMQPTSTAAQEALARSREEQKQQRQAKRSRARQAEADLRYQMRTAKRRKKRRGH